MQPWIAFVAPATQTGSRSCIARSPVLEPKPIGAGKKQE